MAQAERHCEWPKSAAPICPASSATRWWCRRTSSASISTCSMLNTSASSRTRCAWWSKSYGQSWRTSCRRRSRSADHLDAPAVKREAEEDWGKDRWRWRKHRINAHPTRRIYRKNARIESGVRQNTFGSCDLIKEGETGDAKCLTRSTLAPP